MSSESKPRKKIVVMLVKNTFTHDARVEREAQTLIANGYEVTVIGLKSSETSAFENRNKIGIVRVKRGFGSKLRSISDPNSKHSSRKLNVIKAPLIKLVRFLGSTFFRDLIEVYVDKNMINVALKVNPDIIHAHDLDTLRAGSIIKKKTKATLIYDSHEMATGRNLANRRRVSLSHKNESKYIKYVDVVITAAPGYSKKISQLYSVPKSNLHTILNTPYPLKNKLTKRDLRDLFNIPREDLLLVHQGVLLPNRGVDQLIDAISQTTRISLVVLGYGQHRPILEIKVKKLNLQHRVHFLGPVSPLELIEWSASAQLGICTIVGKSDSYKHSMPNKLFEYIQAGLPVLASNYEGMGSFVIENKFGFVCNPLDVDEMSNLLIKIESNREILKKFSNSVELAKSKFNWEVESSKLIKIYSDLEFKN